MARRSSSAGDNGPFWIHGITVEPISNVSATTQSDLAAVQFSIDLDSLAGGQRTIEVGMPIKVLRDTLLRIQADLMAIRRDPVDHS